MSQIRTIGLDISKETFQAHGVDALGKIVVRRRLRRDEVESYFRSLDRCTVGIEATGGSHHWARLFRSMGHSVRLIHTTYAKAFVKTNKNDPADAEAICEAIGRPHMRFVPIKSKRQQATLMMHRVRTTLIGQRTKVINALRGHLAEFGVVSRLGSAGRKDLFNFLTTEGCSHLPRSAREALRILADQYRALELQIKKCDDAILQDHDTSASSQRLATIPYIGPITASAFVATIGDAKQFRSGRDLSAWIGLVPKQFSSGGKDRLGHISKRGNTYLRKLLYLAASAAMRNRNFARLRVVSWARSLLKRKPARVAVIALASKFARIIWALLRRHQNFMDRPLARVTAA